MQQCIGMGPVRRAAVALTVLLVSTTALVFHLRALAVVILASRGEIASLYRAVQIDPQNPELRRRLADAEEMHRKAHLEDLLRLEPRDTVAQTELGLIYEQEGKFAEAGRLLERAAQLDRTCTPAWTLANYYFRHPGRGDFWHWARRSAQVCPDDLKALFRLCELKSGGLEVLERRVVAGLPQAERRYLTWLVEQQRFDAAAQWMSGAGAGVVRSDPAVASWFVEAALKAGRGREAAQVWRRFGPPDAVQAGAAGKPASLRVVNGFFRAEPAGGFDWRLFPTSGVRLMRRPAGDGSPTPYLRIWLRPSVNYWKAAEQYVPLEAAGRYELRWRYRAAGLDMLSRVAIAFRVEGSEGAVVSASLVNGGWRQGRLEFRIPPEAALARLAVVYQGQAEPLEEAVVDVTGFEICRLPEDR